MSSVQIPKGWDCMEFHKLTKSFDGLRIPLNKSQRSMMHGVYPYYGATGQVDSINDYKFDGRYLLITEDASLANPSNRKKPIAYIANGKFWVNNHAHVIQTNDDLDLDFLQYYINSIDIMSYAGKQSTRPKLNKSVLDKIPVVYPNKTTQKKIVQKLDYILGQLEEKKKEINKYANFEKYDNLLKTSTQKVLSDAFRGKLTERKSSDSSVVEFLKKINPKRENFLAFHDCVPHDIPKEWIWVEINQICDGIVPGRYKPTEFDGDIPWITISDIQNFYTHGSLKNLGVTESAVKKVNMKILPPDTVLMTCIGDVGRTSILKCRGVPNQQLHGFVCKNGMISEYISYAIMSQQSIISKISSKTTVAYLNKTKCNNILIPLAPPEEQKRLIQKIQEKFYEIETLSNKINNIKNSHYLLLNRLDRFSNVILNKAFSGKLVN